MREETVAPRDLPSDRTKDERGAQPERRMKATFYMVCSALFGAISLLGLFLGFFMRGSVGALIAGGEPILRGSYLGVIVEVLRGSIPLPKAESIELVSLLPVFLYFAVFALAAEVLLSLALVVFTCIKQKSARFFCTLNGFLTLFVYGVLCVTGVLLGSLREEIYSWRQLDLPSLTAVLLAFCVFAVIAIAHRGPRGAVNVLLLLFNAFSVCAFIFPKTPLLSDLNLIATYEVGAVKRILMGFLCVVIIANLILSVLRLEHPHGLITDIFRFAVQFVAALALAAAYLTGGDAASFFTDQPFACVFLLLSPLADLLIAAFANTFRRKEKKEPAPASPPAGYDKHEAPEPETPTFSETPDFTEAPASQPEQ